MFKIKTGYRLKYLTPEKLKLLWNIKSKITKVENYSNKYQKSSRVLYTFLIIGQLLDLSPKHFILLKTLDSVLPYVELWFTDQNFKLLEI